MTDLSHLDALRLRLSNERVRLEQAKQLMARKPTQRNAFAVQTRAVWVAGIEKEIAAELAFLGIEEPPADTMTDDELLAALRA